MQEQIIVKNSVRKIFRECGFADASKMTQRDFEFVSTKIEEKTGIVLSSTTLKRLANGEFSRLPQVATLNAIARYLGADNWVGYTGSQPAEVVLPKKYTLRKPMIIAVIALAVVLMAFFMTRDKRSQDNLDKATFSAKKTTDNSVPNTVVFSYNVDNVDADSFFIQQSWDDLRRVRVYKKQYTLTDIYYEPGFHLAKLIANDSMIKQIEVSIPTDRWMFYANERKKLYKTEYINDVDLPPGMLAVTEEDLARNDIDTKENKVYIYSYFPTKQEVPGDNFKLKTKVRMKDVKNSVCSFIELEVFCQRGYHIIKAHERGCASESFVIFGDKTIDGKTNNLEKISLDLKEWNEVELDVKDRYVTVKINGAVVLETSYERAMKNVAGLAFISNGLCEVDDAEMSGNDGTVVVKVQ